MRHDPDVLRVFPPPVVVQVKALACQLPCESGVPLSRFSSAESAAEIVNRGIVAHSSGTTVWRWLHEDALRPWYHRSWIFPRDPDFQQKAGRVLDLYHRTWQGRPLLPDEYVVCADEKTSIQARVRLQATPAAQSGKAMRVEHEYERGGALALRPGTSTMRACSDAVSPKRASRRSINWWPKSWSRRPMAMPGASSS